MRHPIQLRIYGCNGFRDGYKYELHFEKGNNIGGLKKTQAEYKHTGTIQTWLPDREVFTDIKIPPEYFRDVLKRQAVVNAGLVFEFIDEESGTTETFVYENGIIDYVTELSADKGITKPCRFESFARGRDREDKPEYKVKMEVAFCFNNEVNSIQYYHNSSWLEYGGAPDKLLKCFRS